MTKFFSWFDPLLLFGSKEDFETLVEFPLQPDETLRIDGNGVFHRLKVPSDQEGLWPKIVFWVHTALNQNRHMDAIGQLFVIFDERLSDKSYLVHQEYEDITVQIEWLNSLKNDYGITSLGQGNPVDIDEKLKELENRANHLYAIYLKQIEIQEEEDAKEEFLRFFKDSQAILHLLSQESWFGLQETSRLRKAYCDDMVILFPRRLSHVQARLLLAQDLSDDIERMNDRRVAKEFKDHLCRLRAKLNDEVDKLEGELELLAEILQCGKMSFDKDQPLPKKMMVIQDHLDQLAA